jgi:hypothetical protein
MVFASEGLPYVAIGAQFVGYGSGFHQPTDEEVRAARALAPQPVYPEVDEVSEAIYERWKKGKRAQPGKGPSLEEMLESTPEPVTTAEQAIKAVLPTSEVFQEAVVDLRANGWQGGYTPAVQVQPRPEPAPVVVAEPEPRKPGIVLPVGATLVVRIGTYETWSGGVFRVVKPFDAEAFMEERKLNGEEQTVREAVEAGFLQALTYYGWQMNRAPYDYINHVEPGSSA